MHTVYSIHLCGVTKLQKKANGMEWRDGMREREKNKKEGETHIQREAAKDRKRKEFAKCVASLFVFFNTVVLYRISACLYLCDCLPSLSLYFSLLLLLLHHLRINMNQYEPNFVNSFSTNQITI